MKHRQQISELPRDKNVQRKWEAIYRILFPDPDQPTQSNPKVPSTDNFQNSSDAVDTKPSYSDGMDCLDSEDMAGDISSFDFENIAGDIDSLDHENLADDIKNLGFHPVSGPDAGIATLSNLSAKVSKHSTGQNLSRNVELLSRHSAFQQPFIQETVVDSGYGTTSNVSKDRYNNGALFHASMEDSTNLPERASFRRENEDRVEENTAYCDDMDTVYTDRNMVDEITADSHILRLAQDLFQQIKADSLTNSMVEAVTMKLPELLQAFAVNLGYKSLTQMHRDVMAFIHMNRNAIAESFKAISRRSDFVEDTAPQRRDPNPYSLDRWLGSSEDLEFDDFEEKPQDYEDSPNDEGIGYYDKFISDENSYQWLINRLRRETLTSNAASDAMSEIRDRIMQMIPRSNYVSRREDTKGATVTFKLDWNIFGFLAEQNYARTEPLTKTLANVVTLTGSGTDAQALSCSEYLSQTWPSTGPRTLQLIQKLLSSEISESKIVVERPSQLILQASIETVIVTVKVSGSPYFVAEIGEQLAWMSAALRPSLGDQKAVYYTHQPYVDSILPNPSGDLCFDCSIKYRDPVTQAKCGHFAESSCL